MEKRLFDEFWKVVQEGLHSGAASALREYFPRLEASLQALDVTSAYWNWSSSRSEAQALVLLCGAIGFGQIVLDMKSAQTPVDTWSHTIDLSVVPWSEVTEITQHFIREGRGGFESRGLVLSKADLCRRAGDPIPLLPAPDMDNCGGVRVADNRVEKFTDQAVFVAAVIKGQRGRGAETWERDST